MLATIRRNYAPDFDGAHPQGHRKRANGRYIGAACTFCARSAGYYIICIVALLYTQYISSSIILCETSKESMVQCGECKIAKIKNKRQGTMTKGNGSAGGQRAWGLISGGRLLVPVMAGNSGRSQGPQPWIGMNGQQPHMVHPPIGHSRHIYPERSINLFNIYSLIFTNFLMIFFVCMTIFLQKGLQHQLVHHCRREILRIYELTKLRIFDIETNRNQ